MKKIATLLIILTIASFLASCAQLKGKLQPGDKVGDMELVKSFDTNINMLCDIPALMDGTCEIPKMYGVLGISSGWEEDTQELLDTAWKDSEWKLTFDGKEIDLPAFGTFDLNLGEQIARVWAVGILNPTVGKHTIQYDFTLVNTVEKGNHSQTWTFTVLPPEPTTNP